MVEDLDEAKSLVWRNEDLADQVACLRVFGVREVVLESCDALVELFSDRRLVRVLREEHHVQDDSEGPDVDSVVNRGAAGDHLIGHVLRRADPLEMLLHLRLLDSEAEVSEDGLQAPIYDINEDVGTLDVPVNDA